MAPAIGIDLGTVNSCVAVIIKGAVQVIPNKLGKRTTPSYVTFTGQGRLIGEAAKTRLNLQSESTIYGIT